MRLLIWVVERLVECAFGALILILAPSVISGLPAGFSDLVEALRGYPAIFLIVGAFFYGLGGYSITSLVVLGLTRRRSPLYYAAWNVTVFSLSYGVLSYVFFGPPLADNNDSGSAYSHFGLPIATYFPSILVVALCSWVGELVYRRYIKRPISTPITMPDAPPPA